MNKVMVLVGLLGLGIFFSGSAEAAAPVRFFIGGSVEAGHYASYQGYGFGGEIGVQVSEVMSLVAEGASGSSEVEYRRESRYEKSHETMKLTLTPLAFSLHFTAPLGERVQPYVGVGISYCSLTMTDSYDYQSLGYASYSSSSSKSWKFHAVAPVFKIGLAISLIRNVKIVGEYRQIVAKDKMTSTSTYSTAESEFYFGSADLKIGIRIVI